MVTVRKVGGLSNETGRAGSCKVPEGATPGQKLWRHRTGWIMLAGCCMSAQLPKNAPGRELKSRGTLPLSLAFSVSVSLLTVPDEVIKMTWLLLQTCCRLNESGGRELLMLRTVNTAFRRIIDQAPLGPGPALEQGLAGSQRLRS